MRTDVHSFTEDDKRNLFHNVLKSCPLTHFYQFYIMISFHMSSVDPTVINIYIKLVCILFCFCKFIVKFGLNFKREKNILWLFVRACVSQSSSYYHDLLTCGRHSLELKHLYMPQIFLDSTSSTISFIYYYLLLNYYFPSELVLLC